MFGSPVSIDQNLILTGYIGPTQLSLAQRVADHLRMPFVDFGLHMEARTGLTDEDIRIRYGEARLKTLEMEEVSEMALRRGAVLHISGQTLLRGDALDRLSATGPVIGLFATLDAVLQRLHLALGARYHNPRERELAVGMLRREWAVRGDPRVIALDTSTMSEARMVEAIAALWREKAAVLDWRAV